MPIGESQRPWNPFAIIASLCHFTLPAFGLFGYCRPNPSPFALLTDRCRRARSRNGQDGPDRFESERVEFFERVRLAYLARAALDPARFRIVDASRTLDEVERDVRQALQPLLPAAVEA